MSGSSSAISQSDRASSSEDEHDEPKEPCTDDGADEDPSTPPFDKSKGSKGTDENLAKPHFDIDDLSDGVVSDFLSLSPASHGGEMADVDAVLPLRQKNGVSNWARDREVPVKSFGESLAHGRGSLVAGKWKVLQQKIRRQSRKHSDEQAATKRKLDAVSMAFNHAKLRRRDRADPDFDKRLRGGKSSKSIGRSHQGHQPRAWTLAGTVRMAFRCIGNTVPNATSMRPSHRELDGVAAVSLAAQSHQADVLRSWTLITESAQPPWVFVGRWHDSTPLRVTFGLLRELAQTARYWRTQRNMPAALLTHAEYTREVSSALPKVGIVELLAQSCVVAWPVSPTQVSIREIHLPPRFMGDCTASTLFASLEHADKTLELEKLFELTASVDFVVLFVGSDLASQCQRVKQAIAARVLKHNKISIAAGCRCGG